MGCLSDLGKIILGRLESLAVSDCQGHPPNWSEPQLPIVCIISSGSSKARGGRYPSTWTFFKNMSRLQSSVGPTFEKVAAGLLQYNLVGNNKTAFDCRKRY